MGKRRRVVLLNIYQGSGIPLYSHSSNAATSNFFLRLDVAQEEMLWVQLTQLLLETLGRPSQMQVAAKFYLLICPTAIVISYALTVGL